MKHVVLHVNEVFEGSFEIIKIFPSYFSPSIANGIIDIVLVDDKIKEYIVDLNRATRKHNNVYVGASPRGSLAVYRTAQASAAMDGRDYVIPDDVKAMIPYSLTHRLIINPAARIKNVTAAEVLNETMASVRVPGAVAVKA